MTEPPTAVTTEHIRHKFESEGKVLCVRPQATMWKVPALFNAVLRKLIDCQINEYTDK